MLWGAYDANGSSPRNLKLVEVKDAAGAVLDTTYYTNFAGQVMLEVFEDATTGDQWRTFYQYDSAGRLLLKANPSAVTGHDETKPDLLNEVSGNYQYLADATGLIETTEYYTSTTATDSTAGGAAGYVKSESVQHGETGTAVKQHEDSYIRRTALGSTIYVLDSSTIYRNTDGTGAQTTSYAYTWQGTTAQIASLTTSLPVVSAAQNGPGTADVSTAVFDRFGRVIWSKDAGGFLTYTAYDQATGAATKIIQDVDTTQTGDFANLPSGWTTPTGGGLHLVTTMEVDGLGRETKSIDPLGNTTYTVYNDPAHEVRIYRGWDATTGATTGPIEVTREDRPGSYTETLTMSATPAVSAGRPTGAEAISNIETLSRMYTNAAGQVTHAREYFNLSGVTYSTDANLGTEGTNYYETDYSYDKRGRQARVEDAVGTITRTVYDGLDRVVSTWVGLDDVPTTGFWSPTNTAGADLVMIGQNEYDDGGVGDGNLTSVTMILGGGEANRATDFYFDWRNRQIVTKQGVEASESTSLNRPILYSVLDNLGQTAQSLTFDGDAVTIVDANSDGIPDQPSASLLRAKTTTDFDDQGRAFKNTTSEVNQTTGAIGGSTIVDQSFHDPRGLVTKTSDALGRETLYDFDGIGRMVEMTLPDPDGAGSLTSPVWQYAFDANGNLTTQTDPLGNDTTYEYDKLNRRTKVTQADPDGSGTGFQPVTQYAYDSAGFLASMTDPLSRVTSYTYDSLGRQTSVTLPDPDGAGSLTAPVHSTTYDALGNVLTETDALGNVTAHEYDPVFHWRTQTTLPDPDGAGSLTSPVLESTYNHLGEMLTSEDAENRTTTYERNILGRTSKVTQPDPDGAGIQLAPWLVFTYDVLGGILTQTDRLNQTTTTAYDGFHRQSSITNPNSEVTSFTSDLVGNRLTLTDPESNTTTWDYDALNRVIEEENELLDSRFFEYDAMNNLGEKIDRDDRHTAYEYDNLQRLIEERWLDPTDDTTVIHTINWTYDSAGQLTEAGDSFADYNYSYDGLARTTSIVADIAGLTPVVTLAQAFDANNRRTQLASTIGSTADFQNEYDYDALNRLTEVTQQDASAGNVVADKRIDLSYLADGKFDAMLRYSDLTATNLVAQSAYGYDGTGRLTSLDHTRGLTVFAGYGWAFDAANRKTAFTNSQYSTEDAAYSYDSFGQLTAVDRNGSSDDEAYGFDDNGNRQTANGATYTTTANNRLASDGTYNYEYDAEGNRTKRIQLVGGNPTGATTEYTYDHRNRQTRVIERTSPTGAITKQVDYSYDAFNRRIAKNIDVDGAGANPPEPSFLIHDGQRIVLELEADGDVAHRYLHGNAVDQLFADEAATGDIFWGLTDDQNTARDVIDDAGNVLNHINFDGFGQIKSETAAAVDFLMGFQGMERDEETGLFHADNREYDPLVGRWTQEDKTRDDVNPNRFVSNASPNAMDPTGLAPACIETASSATSWKLVAVAVKQSIGLVGGSAVVDQEYVQTLSCMFKRKVTATYGCSCDAYTPPKKGGGTCKATSTEYGIVDKLVGQLGKVMVYVGELGLDFKYWPPGLPTPDLAFITIFASAQDLKNAITTCQQVTNFSNIEYTQQGPGAAVRPGEWPSHCTHNCP